MEKLLKAYAGADTLETIIMAADKVKAYAARHPMALCILSAEEHATYRKALLTITKI